MKTRVHELLSLSLYSSLTAATAGGLAGLGMDARAQLLFAKDGYQVVRRTMDSRTWSRTVTLTDPVTGVVTPQITTYQELGNGVCYQIDGPGGAWADSLDLIEITANGAQAVRGPFPATFAADITSPSPITLYPPATGATTAAPITLAPLGLFYYDPTPPGKIAQIGLFQSSQAQLFGDNVLVYPDVLPELADLMVVWTHSGLAV